jgi:hypothetical protein
MRRAAALAAAVAWAGASALPAAAAEVALSFAEAPGGVASGFRIERREAGSERFAPIALVGPGVAEFVDRGLPKDARYCYRARALHSRDPAAWSPEVCAAAEDPAPAPPPAESAPPGGSEPSAAPPAPEPGALSTEEAPAGATRIRTTGGWLQVLD